MKNIFLFIICLFMCLGSVFASDFPSPDKRFLVRIEYGNDGPFYSIQDNEKKTVDSTCKLPTRLLWLRWSDDSKTFVSVEHLAGGSLARIFHFDGKGWNSFDEAVPVVDRLGHYSVIGAKIGSRKVHLKYKFTVEKGNGQIERVGMCEFDFDYASSKTLDFEEHSIGWDKYEGIQSLNDQNKLQ